MLYDEHQHGFLKKLSNQIIGHIGDLQDATMPLVQKVTLIRGM
jgi:hypothetical protein